MAQNSLFSRRSLLVQSFLAIPILAASRNLFAPAENSKQHDGFTSEYILDLSLMTFAKGSNANQVVSEVTQRLVDSKKMAAAWFQKCGLVQTSYLKQGLLLSSRRTLSNDGTHLKFVTVWRDQESFLSFFKESEFYKLDYAYIAAGLAPKMASASKVFPATAEAYLLLQNKQTQA